jgi:hypothetical protein
VPLLFYKGTKTIKQLQKEEQDESSSYESNFKTDSSMRDYDINDCLEDEFDENHAFAVRVSDDDSNESKSQ